MNNLQKNNLPEISDSESGVLYIVATPIGNLQDITLRAADTLFNCDVIFSENPIKTKNLLGKLRDFLPQYQDKQNLKVISYNEFEEEQKIPEVLSMIGRGMNVSIVSSAGTPLVSDPGFKLVREAFRKGVKVIPIPGASSVTSALSVSSLPSDKFLFCGFLPRSQGKKDKFLINLKQTLAFSKSLEINPTVIIFESPHRLKQTLEDLEKIFGDIEIVLEKELTKIYEEVKKDKLSEFISKLNREPKGEFIILFNLKD